LGAATADAAYGAVAAFGLTAISSFFVGQKFWLGLLGGLFLCYLGVRTFLRHPAEQPDASQRAGLSAAYFSSFALTLTNPTTILSFVALFAGIGLWSSSDYFAASALVAGVFLGSAAWWLLLSTSVAMFRSRLDAAWLKMVNRLSGCVIFAFGIFSLFTVRHR